MKVIKMIKKMWKKMELNENTEGIRYRGYQPKPLPPGFIPGPPPNRGSAVFSPLRPQNSNASSDNQKKSSEN